MSSSLMSDFILVDRINDLVLTGGILTKEGIADPKD